MSSENSRERILSTFTEDTVVCVGPVSFIHPLSVNILSLHSFPPYLGIGRIQCGSFIVHVPPSTESHNKGLVQRYACNPNGVQLEVKIIESY